MSQLGILAATTRSSDKEQTGDCNFNDRCPTCKRADPDDEFASGSRQDSEVENHRNVKSRNKERK